MKVFIAVIAFACIAGALALTEEQIAKATKHAEICAKETGAEAKQIENMRAGKFDFEVDEKAMCFAKCFLQRSELINDKSEVDEKVTVEKLSQNDDKTKIVEYVNKCKVEKGETPCETAFKLYKCYKTEKLLA